MVVEKRMNAEEIISKYNISIQQLLELLSGENQESIEGGDESPSSK